MNIVIAQQKGGVGKSTTSLIIASVLDTAGREFEVVDLDPQQSMTSSMSMIGLKSTEKAGYRIVDTPPNLEHKETEQELANADIVIIPSGTSVYELQVTASTIPVIQARTKAKIRVLWSKVKTNTTAGKGLDLLEEKLGAETFKTTIKQRECYQQNFLVKGWKGLNTAAREECSQFVIELTTQGV